MKQLLEYLLKLKETHAGEGIERLDDMLKKPISLTLKMKWKCSVKTENYFLSRGFMSLLQQNRIVPVVGLTCGLFNA